MSTTLQEGEGVPSRGASLSLATQDLIEWATIHVHSTGEYYLALPTEEEAKELQQDRPRGKLKRFSNGLLWIEPKFAERQEPISS